MDRQAGEGVNPDAMPNKSAIPGADINELVSRLLMGFVERRVSPTTIADIARAQLVEEKVPIAKLSTATCNGILEVLSGSQFVPGRLDLLILFSEHPSFPEFLSARAVLGSLTCTLRHLEREPVLPEMAYFPRVVQLLRGLLQQCGRLVRDRFEAVERVRLTHLLKNSSRTLDRLGSYLPEAAELQYLLNHPRASGAHASPMLDLKLPPPQEVLQRIVRAPDHVLAQKGTSFFSLHPRLDAESWRLRNIEQLFSLLDEAAASAFHMTFLVEWFFEFSVRNALRASDAAELLKKAMLRVLDAGRGDEATLLKGMLRALQKDLLAVAPEDRETALEHANLLLPELVSIFEADPVALSKDWIPWALALPVHPEECRVFTRSAWQWVRTLAYGIWEEDLRSPPAWISANASRYSARVFRMAPSFWLQDHSYLFLFQLYRDSTRPGFAPQRQHLDFIEYLVRTLKKRCAFYATRLECTVALDAIGRAQPAEANQLSLAEARMNLNLAIQPAVAGSPIDPDKDFWRQWFLQRKEAKLKPDQGPVSQALSLLLRAAREGARVPAVQRLRTGGGA